jgi:hypothetical protein
LGISIDGLKLLSEVVAPDERWTLWSGHSLEGHHEMIASIELNDAVPDDVRQQFENARNTWLYAHFAFRLLSVASLAVHVACETGLRTKALQEGVAKGRSGSLRSLLDEALKRRWIVDTGFSAASNRKQLWAEHRQTMLALGEMDPGPWQTPEDDQAFARIVCQSIQKLRNDMAHGETLLVPGLFWMFRAMADIINQLFPDSA